MNHLREFLTAYYDELYEDLYNNSYVDVSMDYWLFELKENGTSFIAKEYSRDRRLEEFIDAFAEQYSYTDYIIEHGIDDNDAAKVDEMQGK